MQKKKEKHNELTFFTIVPSGGFVSTFLDPTSDQFVERQVPLLSIKLFIIARLASGSASRYICWNSALTAASPSNFSSSTSLINLFQSFVCFLLLVTAGAGAIVQGLG